MAGNGCDGLDPCWWPMLSAMALSCSLEAVRLRGLSTKSRVGRKSIVVVEGIAYVLAGTAAALPRTDDGLACRTWLIALCINDLAVAYLGCIRGGKRQRATHHIPSPIFSIVTSGAQAGVPTHPMQRSLSAIAPLRPMWALMGVPCLWLRRSSSPKMATDSRAAKHSQ